MGYSSYRWNGGQIERVTRVLSKGANAALTQDHVVVAFGHDVLRCQQPFIKRRRQPTLEKNRKVRTSGATQKCKVLHAARADLNYVSVLLNQINARIVERFSNYF